MFASFMLMSSYGRPRSVALNRSFHAECFLIKCSVQYLWASRSSLGVYCARESRIKIWPHLQTTKQQPKIKILTSSFLDNFQLRKGVQHYYWLNHKKHSANQDRSVISQDINLPYKKIISNNRERKRKPLLYFEITCSTI